MDKKLITTDKELQFFKNSTDFKESNAHEVINQGIRRRLVPAYSGYLDQYLSGDAEMHLHIGWSDRRPIEKLNLPNVGRGDKRDYCIVLEKLSTNIQGAMVFNRLTETTHSKAKSAILSRTTNRNKLTVLISVFETTNLSETYRIDIDKASKLIRLQLYDDCSSLRVQSLGSGLKVFPQLGILDHELTIFVLGEDVLKNDWKTRMFSALFWDTGDNNIIKCTSQVMYEITEHNGNHRIRLLSDMEASPDFILSIRHPDRDGCVRLAACVPHGFFLDVYHVLLCPLVFEPPIFIHDVLQYPYGEESGKDTKDSKGARDTRAHKRRIPRQPKEGSKVNASQPEEVKPQTSSSPRSGDYTAKNTHSGSLEDV